MLSLPSRLLLGFFAWSTFLGSSSAFAEAGSTPAGGTNVGTHAAVAGGSGEAGSSAPQEVDDLIAREAYSAAVEKLKQQICARPAAPELHEKLAFCFTHLAMFDQAFSESRLALNLDDTTPRPWLNLASAALCVGDVQSARSALAEILRRFPKCEERLWVRKRMQSLTRSLPPKDNFEERKSAKPALLACPVMQIIH